MEAESKSGIPWAGARVAVVHDWFQGFHGSERVVDAIVGDVLADAAEIEIFTFHAARELLPDRLRDRIARESRLAALPGIRQRGHDPGRWRYLLPLMPRFFRGLDLRGFDLVVSSSHACAINAQPPQGVPYACYTHTPMRYAWLPDTDRDRVGGPRGALLRLVSGRLRRADLAAAPRVDGFLANSSAVAERIRSFYGREAEVIPPPVDVEAFGPEPESDRDGYLWAHRLVPYKRPTEVVEAFRGSGERLTMVGIGPLEDELRAILPSNVELLGWIDRGELVARFRRARGFIHVAEEDFGISMVEALAAGTPVIALDAGGARDIVSDGETGILVAESTPEAIRAAIERLEATEWDRRALVAAARRFSREAFRERMRDALTRLAGQGGPHGG